MTPWEVVRYSDAGRDFPLAVINKRIGPVQQQIGREKLGYDLYLALIEDLNTLDTTPDEWEDCGDYDELDVVQKHGVYYQSTADGNNSDPEVEGSDWIQWDLYLRTIFADTIYMECLPFATRTSTKGGLRFQEKDEHGVRSATDPELSTMEGKLRKSIDRDFRNMSVWLSNTDEGKSCLSIMPDSLLTDGFPGPAEGNRSRQTMYRTKRWIT